ncbi:hypothetical protein MSSD14B_38540 [Marinobacter salsuginis]|uniref:Uncharacterized protein n=1 Tax=Marinobacter salsuginis TaxID=418719 RepID=A0A5M3Q4S4_9GAMM|nr:hypothetical protein MSSD14B_38540 [Marinobacter salsuginis]
MAKVNLHITLNGEPYLQQARSERVLECFSDDSAEKFVTENHILIRCVGIDRKRAEMLLDLPLIANDITDEDSIKFYDY